VAGLMELREAIADLYNVLYRQGARLEVLGGERLRLRRRARSADAPRRRAWVPSTSGTSSRLHGRTRSCSTSSRRSPRSRSCSRASAATRSRTRSASRDPGPAGSPRCSSRTPATPREARRRRRARRWVGVARELDCALLLDEFYSHYIYRGRPGELRWRARPGTSTTVRRRSDRDLRRLHEELALTLGWRVTWALGRSTWWRR